MQLTIFLKTHLILKRSAYLTHLWILHVSPYEQKVTFLDPILKDEDTHRISKMLGHAFRPSPIFLQENN